MFPRDPNAYDPTNDIYSDDLFAPVNAKFIQTFISKLKPTSDAATLEEMEKLTPAQRRAYILPPQKKINPHLEGNSCELVSCGDTNIGVCEVMGMRPTQEDATAFALTDAFKALEPDKQSLVITKLFAAMQAEAVEQDADTYGSTMSVCFAWTTKANKEGVKKLNVQLGYVGDSPVYLVRIDIDNPKNNITCLKLTRNDHHATQADGKFNELTDRYELPDGFPMTRAIGDISTEKYGLRHDPELYTQSFEVQPTERTFIVMGCDGLFEDLHNKTEAELVTLKYEMSAKLDFPLHEIAKQLVKRSAVDGTKDNITCMVIEPTDACVATCVADGHGASIMSRYIGDNFQAVASTTLEAVIGLQKTQRSFLCNSVNIANVLMQPAVYNTFSSIEKESLKALMSTLTVKNSADEPALLTTEQRLASASLLAKQTLATKSGLFGKPAIRSESLHAYLSLFANADLRNINTAVLMHYQTTWFTVNAQPLVKTG